MKIQFKPGTDLTGVKPEMVMGHITVAAVFDHHSYDCIATSVTDGDHQRASLHYPGYAIDYRLRHVSVPVWDRIEKDLKTSLGPQFDVILNEAQRIVHVEYQPK